jgi:hypothetical protein
MEQRDSLEHALVQVVESVHSSLKSLVLSRESEQTITTNTQSIKQIRKAFRTTTSHCTGLHCIKTPSSTSLGNATHSVTSLGSTCPNLSRVLCTVFFRFLLIPERSTEATEAVREA